MSDLDLSAVHKLKVPELRSELMKRGLEAKGLKHASFGWQLVGCDADDEETIEEFNTTSTAEVAPEPPFEINDVVLEVEDDILHTTIDLTTPLGLGEEALKEKRPKKWKQNCYMFKLGKTRKTP